jgi:SAM-dependent methyltransferase
MSELPPAATRLLDEARASELSLDVLPANSAKIRLALDLVRELPATGKLRVLDVGCGGRNEPLNVWQPFLPLAGRLEVTGIDVAFLEETRARAAELGFPIEVRHGSVLELSRDFEHGSFDAVVTTQVLEHVRDWRRALAELASVLRPGGLLLLTCDSGDLARPAGERAKLVAKRAVARAPALARRAHRVVSGEWEYGPTLAELREGARDAGLEVEDVAHYALRDVKEAKGGAGARLLGLALEEALREERGEPFDPGRYRILYLRARQPRQPPVSPL